MRKKSTGRSRGCSGNDDVAVGRSLYSVKEWGPFFVEILSYPPQAF